MSNRLGWRACLIGVATLALTTGALGQRYRQVNLVSDGSLPAVQRDPNLVNPWGLAESPTSPFWVADAGTGLSTLYDTDGNIRPLVVTVPPADSAPTGLVFNGGTGFVVNGPLGSGPARFIFVTENGTVAGWNPAADATNAIQMVDNSASEAIYKGAALGRSSLGTLLFATNFHSGMVDVFNDQFHMIGSFTDRRIPAHYAPFGIQNIGGVLVVTFALQDEDMEDDVPGLGHGFVDVFDTTGRLLRRFASRGRLNSPWGIALAPSNFGRFSRDLLIGNFGDGRINAYNPRSGAFLGQLETAPHQPVAIEGLWSLMFGNGHAGGDTNKLYFTAGPDDENAGLFGYIQAVHR